MPKARVRCYVFAGGGGIPLYSVCTKTTVDAAHVQVMEASSYIWYAEIQWCNFHIYTWWGNPHIFCIPKANGGFFIIARGGGILIYSVCTKPTAYVADLHVFETSSYILYAHRQRRMLPNYTCLKHPHIFSRPKSNGVCCTITGGWDIPIHSLCQKPTVHVEHLLVGEASTYSVYARSQRCTFHTHTRMNHPHIYRMPKANGRCCTITRVGSIPIYSVCPKPMVYFAHLHVVEASPYIPYV